MELQSDLVDKLQVALIKVCPSCGSLSGQSIYYQFLGRDIECQECISKNRLLYLPLKLMMMKASQGLGIPEAELKDRLNSDMLWNRLLESLFTRISNGEGPGAIFETGLPMVFEVDLDKKVFSPEVLAKRLKKLISKGCIGVKFVKTGQLDGEDRAYLDRARSDGYLISLAYNINDIPVNIPPDLSLDHLELRFTSIERINRKSLGNLQTIVHGKDTAIAFVIHGLPKLDEVSQLVGSLPDEVKPKIMIFEDPNSTTDPTNINWRDVAKEIMERNRTENTFWTIRDPILVDVLTRMRPDSAILKEGSAMVVRGDLQRWKLPAKGILPPEFVFSQSPMHLDNGELFRTE